MGWTFKWLSSLETEFNFNFHVSFTPEEVAAKDAPYNFQRQDPFVGEREGVSVFFKDPGGAVYHTYSTYARGIDMLSVDYKTWCPRAATKAIADRSGCAGTTNMRLRRGPNAAADNQ
jgi:predicted dithiol-disulfide oxidoreductase (DUF899 family)